MKVAVMQPYLLPYVGYWQLVRAADVFVMFDDVSYIKRGYIDRNYCLRRGEPIPFKLRVAKASQNRAINEHALYDGAEQILEVIKQCYGKTAFYDETLELLAPLLTCDEKNLARFVGNSIKGISEALNFDTEVIYSSDLRLDCKGKEKIIPMVKALGGTEYINMIGGAHLYSEDEFHARNIDLSFLRPLIEEYDQGISEFVPHLSIVDSLCHVGASEVENLTSKYEYVPSFLAGAEPN